jgi:hypothetical protein
LGKPIEESGMIYAQAEKIRESIETSWNPNQSFYSYRDRETGLVSTGKILAKKKGDGNMRPKFESENGVRLLIEINETLPPATPE